MKTEIKKILDKFKEKRVIAWENYREVCKAEQEELKKYLDFKNKYYRIDDCGSIYYLYVRSQVVGEYLSTEKPGLQLKGLGFYIPQSDDYIDFFCDQEFSYSIDLTDIDNELNNKISEITEEEFKDKFSEWISKVSYRFDNYFNGED
jgi:hypothetical protein